MAIRHLMRDLHKVRLFVNLSCFIEGPCAIKDRPEFVKSHKNVYPSRHLLVQSQQ